MKKLIIILLICSGLVSCFNGSVYDDSIVEKVYKSENGYYVYENNKGIGLLKSKKLIYNVGDTIKFTK